MKNLQKLKEKIAADKPCFGIMVSIADCCISEMIGYAGYDFVWIDTEHGALGRREIFHHILAAQSAGAAAFVRVPGTDPTHVKAILDMGADGIIFPFVNNPARAEEAVRACLYPPKGMRGQGPLRAINYGIDDEGEYIRHDDENAWVICQIETEEGYNNLDAIMDVPGIHSLFVGPADLGRSIILPEPEKSQRFGFIMDDLPKRIREKGIIAGGCCGPSPEDVKKTVGRGYNWMFIGQDARLISGPLVENMKKLRELYK